MDKDFLIYRTSEEEIPSEDKARLEGYLEAKFEAAEKVRLERQLELRLEDMKEELTRLRSQQ